MKIVLSMMFGLLVFAVMACASSTPATEPAATRAPLALVTDTIRPLPIVDETNTPTDEPTATLEAADAPTAQVTDIPNAIDSDTATATEAVTTDTSPSITATATVTPTLPPIVFLPPFDGGMNLSAFWSENGLELQARANDVVVGGNDGDGIDHVDIFIQNSDGSTIAENRLTQAPYCYFGIEDASDDICHVAEQGADNFVWSPGNPIQPGLYFVRAVAYTTHNQMQVAEQPVNITIPVNTLENLFVNIDQPNDTNVSGSLSYEASVSGVGVDSGSGAGIDRVEMFVVDADGKILNKQIEQTPFYCGFADAGLNQPCNVYAFAAHDFKWQNGDAIQSTEYLLRVIAYAKDGRSAAQSEVIRISE